MNRNRFSSTWLVLLVLMLTGLVSGLAAQEWACGAFKPGQYFKYTVKTERGLSGWVSLKVSADSGKDLAIQVDGEWMGGFSEKLVKTPKTSASDLVYSAEDPQIPNILSGLLNIDQALLENARWKQGFSWKAGTSSIKIDGSRKVAGLEGLLAIYESVNSFSNRARNIKLVVRAELPVPLFVEWPAANDTWTYELVEAKP